MIDFLPRQLFLFDPLTLLFLAVIGLVCAPSAIFSIGYLRGETKGKNLLAWVILAIFVLSMCLVVISGNLFTFLVSWELMSLFSYFLVVFEHTREKSLRAGIIYLVMTHIGTACLMAAFFLLYTCAGSFDFYTVKQAALALSPQTRNVIFLLLFLGFSTKAGVVPLHIWLPYAHPQAPSHISSIMSGVMIKIAVYGMIRFFLTLLGFGPSWWGMFILAFAAVSCLIGVIYALMDHDIKKLLAYSSIENIGIILLGVGAAILFANNGVMTVAVFSLYAGLYHLVNHALFKGLLFLCAGSIVKGAGIRDMEKLGGLIKTMPLTALFFLIGAMGISALPPFNGFVSEWLIFQAFFGGILQSQGWIRTSMFLSAAVLALTSGLAAACFVKAFGITFLAMPRSQYAEEAEEASWTMKAGMGILAAAVILFGIGAGVIGPIIYRVAQYSLGISEPVVSFRWFAVEAPLNQGVLLSPLVAALLLLFSLGGFWTYLKLARRAKNVYYNTWDCGYYSLDSRTEYSGTAFSKPFRIAFGFFLFPYRKIEKIRDSFYHVRTFTYETHTTPVFEKHFYRPLLKFVYGIALGMRKLQPGIIHIYILYIFLTIAAMVTITGIFNL